MKKRTPIAIDIGGTIEDTWTSKLHWFRRRGINIDTLHRGRNEVVSLIGGDDSVYQEMVDEVYSKTNIPSLKAVPGSLEAIRALSANYRIAAVSSRSADMRVVTIQWMKRNRIFPFVDKLVFLGNAANKIEWCEDNGVRYLVDDDIRHLEVDKEIKSLRRILLSPMPTEQYFSNTNVFIAKEWKTVLSIIRNSPKERENHHAL